MSTGPSLSGYRAPSRFEYPETLLTVASVVVMVAAVVVGAGLAGLVRPGGVVFSVGPSTFLVFVGASLLAFPLAIVLHELIHGAVARLLGYHVTFGTSRLGRLAYVAYAAAFDQPLSRRDTALIVVAPLVVVTLACVVAFAVVPEWLVLPVGLVFVVNTMGAVGDVYLLAHVARLPRGSVYYDVSPTEMLVYVPDA